MGVNDTKNVNYNYEYEGGFKNFKNGMKNGREFHGTLLMHHKV
jgi:hypothetical protein